MNHTGGPLKRAENMIKEAPFKVPSHAISQRKEFIQRSETFLPVLSQKYADELRHILKNLEDSYPSMKTIEDKEQRISWLASEITTHKDAICENSKQLLRCLKDVQDVIEMDERFLRMNKIFFDNLLVRAKSVLRKLFFGQNYESVTHNRPILHEFFLSMKNIPIEEVRTISAFGTSHRDVSLLLPHVQNAVSKLNQEHLQGYSKYLQDADKESLIQNVHKEYPDVGKNNLAFFASKSKVQILDNSFQSYMEKWIEEYMLDNINSKLSSYKNIALFFNELALILSIIFFGGDLKNAYNKFTTEYLSDMFMKIQSRKFPSKRTSKPLSATISTSLNESVYNNAPKKAIPKELFTYLNTFLEPIAIDTQKKSEIRRFLLRTHSNKKDIRISDLESRCGNCGIFTPEVVAQLRNLGCHILHKETKEDQPQETITHQTSTSQSLIKQPTTAPETHIEADMCDALLHDMEHFSREKVLPIFQSAGYTIEKKDTFIKQLENIFSNAAQKKIFLHSLKSNIKQVNKKATGFYSIEIAGFHRILMFQKNIIDGIYNHRDYDKRIKENF